MKKKLNLPVDNRKGDDPSPGIDRRDFIKYTAKGTIAGAGFMLLPGWVSAGGIEENIRFKGLSLPPSGKLTTWYRRPAERWDLGSPLGNGSLGIMAFGNVNQERLNLNMDTLYAGGPHAADNPAGPQVLKKIDEALLAGKTQEAEALWQENIRGKEWFITPFSRLGNLTLTFKPVEEVYNYKRELDIEQAEFRISYMSEETEWERQMFVSCPDQVMVKRISTKNKSDITLDIELEIDPGCEPEIEMDNGDLCLEASNLPYEGLDGVLKVAARVRVIPVGGSVSVSDNRIKVMNASEVILLLAAETSYVNYNTFDRDPVAICRKRIEKASKYSFEELRKHHLDDYQAYFRRFRLELTGESKSHIPTDLRVQNWRKSIESGMEPDDLQLITLFCQMSRYLWLSCSRPGTQPMTVVGIWNERPKAAWGGVWANNINGPQLYWGVEETNLAEMHEPWLQMISELTDHGRTTASTTFGLPGWAVFLRTDVWRYTSLEAEKTHNAFPQAGPWLCHHLWEHFLFSGDKKFLADAYPVMKGSAEFFMNYMVLDPRSNKWLAGPSGSPEWGPLALGITMSQMIAWDLFGNCIQAAEVLDKDEEFRKVLAKRMEEMAPLEISTQGHLPEWRLSTDVKAGSKGGDNSPDASYRHMGHMYALTPAAQINPRDTPELTAAIKNSIIQRRNSTGPSFTFTRKINAWARLFDEKRAFDEVQNYIGLFAMENMIGSARQLIGDPKKYRYLLHAEASTAFLAGICEMLVQSHAGEIYILPAWSASLGDGNVTGLRTRGGFEIDIEWRRGSLVKAVIHSTIGGVIRVRTNIPVNVENAVKLPVDGKVPNPLLEFIPWKLPEMLDPDAIESPHLPESYLLQFNTEPGKAYKLIS